MKANSDNERLKRAYVRYLRDARRKSESSIDQALEAIDRFEVYTRRRDFRHFRAEQATAFKDHLARQLNVRTKQPISPATQLHTLGALRAFFSWLADQPTYRRGIRYTDAQYFSMPFKDAATARVSSDTEGPTVEQVRHVVQQMPAGTDVEKRDRALVAFALVSGARDGALASLRVKHVDLKDRLVRQDPREVRTKASKLIETWFFPVGDDFLSIVDDWVSFLTRDRQWGRDDPLFPRTKVAVGASRRFEAAGLDRSCWSNATPIRAIFRNAFTTAGLRYFNPHSFRKTLARLGQEQCRTPEELKAWSQNLGHEKVLTTFTSYGQVDRLRQREIIFALSRPTRQSATDLELLLRQALKLSSTAPDRARSGGMYNLREIVK
jgi:integrase